MYCVTFSKKLHLGFHLLHPSLRTLPSQQAKALKKTFDGIFCSKLATMPESIAMGQAFKRSNEVKFFHFYRAMLRRARYCYGKLSVCPSVRNVEVL